MNSSEINVNGEIYVKKSSVKASSAAKPVKGMRYKIVRTAQAGVFAGYLKSRAGTEAVMVNARRLWYWDGAASLSQLAVDGVSKPENCKFPCEVAEVELTGVIEVLEATEKAKASIDSVAVWKQ